MSITSPSSSKPKTAEDYQREVDIRAAKTPGDMTPSSSEILSRLILEMSEMTADELGVLDQFIGKYMREGRREYGPLDLANDPRSLIKIIMEAADEGLDREFYLGAAKLKRFIEEG